MHPDMLYKKREEKRGEKERRKEGGEEGKEKRKKKGKKRGCGFHVQITLSSTPVNVFYEP